MIFDDFYLIFGTMTALIRTTSFIGFRELTRELGGDADAMLDRFHINPALLDDEDARLPLSALVGLLEHAANSLDCPDFGLRMAKYQDMQILGPIAVIALSCATVGQALTDIVRFISYHSPGIELELNTRDSQLTQWVITLNLPQVRYKRQMTELALGVALNAMKLLCGSNFAPYAVSLTSSSTLPPATYRRYFASRVLTGEAHNALVMTAEQLARPIEQQNYNLHRTLEDYLQQHSLQNGSDLVAQVNKLISRLLPTHRCRLPTVAEQLGLHPRVLQRRLGELDMHFDELLEGIRKELTEQYLAERHMPISQIAGLLGYSEQSVLNRACKRWFGLTPLAFRRKLLSMEASHNQH